MGDRTEQNTFLDWIGVIIYLAYRYQPTASALYFERALKKEHEVISISSSYKSKRGYPGDVEITELIDDGNPKPEIVLLIDTAGEMFPRGLEKISCPTAIFLIDMHANFELRKQMSLFYDYIFLAQKDYIDTFKKTGNECVYWLPHACDPEIHVPGEMEKIYDVGFVGHVHSDHRRKKLEFISKHFKINDFNKPYPRDEISTIYGQSKIVFNCSLKDDLNMRVFEAMASGALLITDRIPNGQSELFKDGEHLVEYTNDDDLLQKIDYYLKNEHLRLKIAKAGQKLVLAQHTYSNRCQTILNTISSSKKIKSALVRKMSNNNMRTSYAKLYCMFGMVEEAISQAKMIKSMLKKIGICWEISFLMFKKIVRLFRYYQ
jgi:hypothetical protein